MISRTLGRIDQIEEGTKDFKNSSCESNCFTDILQATETEQRTASMLATCTLKQDKVRPEHDHDILEAVIGA